MSMVLHSDPVRDLKKNDNYLKAILVNRTYPIAYGAFYAATEKLRGHLKSFSD